MRKSVLVFSAFVVLGLSGCATSFIGSAYVKGGATSCQSKCEAQGLTLAGMVFLGEYTDGCVCAVPGRECDAIDGAGAAGAGAVGVILETRRRQEQQRQR